MIRKLVATAALSVVLYGCAGGVPGDVLGSKDTAAVQNFLKKTADSRIDALKKSYNNFAAATPQFTDGMTCVGSLPDPSKPIDNVGMTNLGTGLLSVWAAVQREINANPASSSGLSAEELVSKATIYQPNSAQFSWVVKQIESGCVGYLHDVNQATNSTAGMFASPALGAMLIGAPVGM